MVNIRDVAKATGFSVSTVSRVINQNPYVSQEKRDIVLKIMEELEYVPNKTARNLSYGKTMNVGVMIPNVRLPWFSRMLTGIVETASEEGYTITILPTYHDKKIEEKYFQNLLSKAYDGLIILSKSTSFESVEKYAEKGSIVCCENTGDYKIPCVYVDREISYRKTMEELKADGINNLGITTNRSEALSPSMRTTIDSYEEVFGPLQENQIYRNCTTYEDGLAAGDYFYENNRDIQGVFANGDVVAAGISQSKLGKEKIRLIGQGNELISELFGFSTLDHHLEENGREAFKLLISGEFNQIMMPNQLIRRE